MKRVSWKGLAVALAVAGWVGASAQDAATPAAPGPMGLRRGVDVSGGAEGMIARLAENPQLGEKIGLTPEQKKKIQDGAFDIRKDIVKLQAELELAAMDQARLRRPERFARRLQN